MGIEDYRYRTELHAHTKPVSHCADFEAEEVVRRYAELGYNTLAITNHFYSATDYLEDKEKCIEAYLNDYRAAYEAGKKYGINVVLGCEINFYENHNDYLVFGIDEGFFDLAYELLTEHKGIKELSESFRSDDTILIHAHPFRDRMTIVPSEYLDGVEVYNMHSGQNSRVFFAARYAKENDLIVTAGTDFHHDGHEGAVALLTKTEIKNSFDVVKILKSRDYLIEIGGTIILPYGKLPE